jgi:hypothetical protein
LENNIRKFFILEDKYNCPVELSTLYRLFGKKSVSLFLESNPQYMSTGKWVGTDRTLKNIERRKTSNKKMEYAKDLSGFFHLIPWIRFAAVSGAVSFGSADTDSDIDIFLVAAKNRVWITRGFEELLLNILGVRRVMWRKGVNNKLCINFYTSESKLRLDMKKRYKYLTALEIAMLKPIYNEKYLENILGKNMWVKKFFPGISTKSVRQKKFIRIPVVSEIFDLLDLLAMYLQFGFMKVMGHTTENSKMTRDRIMFFDQNKEWESRIEELL